MCLSTVYLVEGEDKKLLCRNIASVKRSGDRLVFTDIMGIPTTVDGELAHIDLMDNYIYVNQRG